MKVISKIEDWYKEYAMKAKKSKIIAVDSNEKSLNELKSNIRRLKVRNIIMMKGDARKLSKIEGDSIDFVFSHWLLGVVINIMT